MDLLRELFHHQKASLDHFFQSVNLEEIQRALESVAECQGTLVLTGIGKSGLIAQKIAATLVSTGTPARFLCPMNALHGDMGVLSEKDMAIFFSKSGHTHELLELFAFVEKKGLKTLAVVSSHGSNLEKKSTLSVHLPVLRELCPYDLAPTTSTAIQLLFGDLLAMALMRRKQFSVDDFAANHPAGTLGKLIRYRVADLMLKGDKIPLCAPTDRLIDMLHELSVKRCGCLIVADVDRSLLGIFTDGDLRRAIKSAGPSALDQPLRELMTARPKVIASDRLAIDAVRMMEEDPNRLVTVLPVLDGERVVGLIRMHDILQSGLS